MKNYSDFELEDFLADESFVIWTLAPGDKENQFWEAFQINYPEQKENIDRAKAVLFSLKPLQAVKPLTAEEIAEITGNIHQRTTLLDDEIPVIRLYQRTWFKLAAMLIVLLSVVLVVRQTNNNKPDQNSLAVTKPSIISYSNKEDSRKMIRLEDGTLVFLSPNSTLKYPARFQGVKREVDLTGEAFFEVQKNPSKPFLVHSGTMVTRVLGTSFTVKAFPDQAKFSVVVNTGRVEVMNEDANHKVLSSVIITPNQQVTLARKELKLNKDTVASPLLLSPEVSTRVFSFNNAPLGEIIAKLEEAYGVKIEYDQQKYAQATVTASLAKLPLDQKVQMICKAIDAECSFDNGQITIR